MEKNRDGLTENVVFICSEPLKRDACQQNRSSRSLRGARRSRTFRAKNVVQQVVPKTISCDISVFVDKKTCCRHQRFRSRCQQANAASDRTINGEPPDI